MHRTITDGYRLGILGNFHDELETERERRHSCIHGKRNSKKGRIVGKYVFYPFLLIPAPVPFMRQSHLSYKLGVQKLSQSRKAIPLPFFLFLKDK